MRLHLRSGDKAGRSADQLVKNGIVELHERRDSMLWVMVEDLPAGETPTAWLDAQPLIWSESRRGFELPAALFGHFTGCMPLTVRAGDEEELLVVRVAPHKDKAALADWLEMLRQLERWLPGVTIGQEGGRHGSVSEHGALAPLLGEAVARLVPELSAGLRDILPRLKHYARSSIDDMPLQMIRRTDGEVIRALGTRPDAGQWLVADEPCPYQARIPQHRTIDGPEHPANRYLAWLVDQVLRWLRELKIRLGELGTPKPSKGGKKASTDLRTMTLWCHARATLLARDIDELERVVRASPLRALPRDPEASAGAHSVIADDPVYARIHGLGRLILSPRFRWMDTPEAANPAAVRPSFDLYELWTLLFVKETLAATLPGWTWTPHGMDRLLFPEHGDPYEKPSATTECG